jgi:hypothetical protein
MFTLTYVKLAPVISRPGMQLHSLCNGTYERKTRGSNTVGTYVKNFGVCACVAVTIDFPVTIAYEDITCVENYIGLRCDVRCHECRSHVMISSVLRAQARAEPEPSPQKPSRAEPELAKALGGGLGFTFRSPGPGA